MILTLIKNQVVLLLLGTLLLVAGQPSWIVNPSVFNYNSTITGILVVNDTLSQSENIVAAFVGSDIRGVASPIHVGNMWMYFMTLYSNAASGETISFKSYIANADFVSDIQETLPFTANGVTGNPVTPFPWHTYFIYDHKPIVHTIHDQTIESGGSFSPFDLDNYLTELDGDTILWSIVNSTNLTASINANHVVTIIPSSGFIGTESIIIIATDKTAHAYSGADTTSFTILPFDFPPQTGNIPNQTIGLDGSFQDFNLDSYLILEDENTVSWRYKIQQHTIGTSTPSWSVNPSAYQFSMNVTARIFSQGNTISSGNHLLAAYSGNELRGVTQGIILGDSMLFFLMVYSNTSGEQLHFKFYDSIIQEILPVFEKAQFSANAYLGNPSSPLQLNAGHLLYTIDNTHQLHTTILDTTWTGSDSVLFTVNDNGTSHTYADSDMAVFSILPDHTPHLRGIPNQTIEIGQTFAQFDLNAYLREVDGNGLLVAYSGNTNLSIVINSSRQVTVSPISSSWTGNETIVFTVTDNTLNAFHSSDTVTFTVEPIDHPPTLNNIPNQTIGLFGSFIPFDLDMYLNEVDGDSIVWTYRYQTNPQHHPAPAWTVNPALYQFSMYITAEVTSRNSVVSNGNNVLGAFVGSELRGVAQPTFTGGRWLFFITVYSSTESEQLHFKVYDVTLQDVVPVKEHFEFVSNMIYGTPSTPYAFTAGNILLSKDSNNRMTFEVVDSLWTGSETINFMVQDANRSHHYSATDQAIYSVIPDHSPLIRAIPDQTTQQGHPFTQFDLDNYLQELDGQQVRWGASYSSKYNISIDANNIVTLTPRSAQWVGSDNIIFKVHDVSTQELFALDTVSFSVIHLNHKPTIYTSLSQEIPPTHLFTPIHLDSSLTEPDGDSVVWSYSFLPPSHIDAQPTWVVTPANYQYAMTVTATVNSLGKNPVNPNNLLAAFGGNELRGVTAPIPMGNTWLYFLTIYGNTDGDSIRFKFYDGSTQRLLPVKQKVQFSSNVVYGNPITPLKIDAGNLILTMSQGNIVGIERTVQTWLGSESVMVITKEVNTPDLYSDTTIATFSVIQDAFGNSQSDIIFGNLSVHTAKTDTISVINKGSGNLVISSVTVDSADYSVTPSSATLAENQKQDFIVTFTPSSSGSKNAHLTFIHNAYLSPRTIALNGSGRYLVLTATKNGNGTIIPVGQQNSKYGDTHSYTISPDRGYRLDSVIVDGSNQGAIPSYQFTNIIADHSIASYFSLIPAYGVSYRSATMEDWATAVNQKGKRKPMRRAYENVSFAFDLTSDQTRTLHLGFSMNVHAVITKGSAPFDTIGSFTGSSYNADLSSLIPAGQLIHITGIGSLGRNITTKYAWGSSVMKPIMHNQYSLLRLGIPLPNLNNVGIEMFGIGRHGAFPAGLRVGVSQGSRGGGSVIHYKYKDVLASLATQTSAGFVFHTEGPKCFNRLDNGDSMTSRERSLPIGKQNNKLFAEALALKLNINASKLGKFPVGLGELTYYDTLGENVNPFNGLMIKQISAKADTMLSCLPLAGNSTATLEDLYDAIHDLNGVFRTDGKLDTISFFKRTILTGVKRLVEADIVKTTPGVTPDVLILDETASSLEQETPTEFALYQNYPNPFNPATMLSFSIGHSSLVSLKVYNLLGQEVASLINDEQMDEGNHEVNFDATNFSSGVYFYRIHVESTDDDGIQQTFTEVKRMVLLK